MRPRALHVTVRDKGSKGEKETNFDTMFLGECVCGIYLAVQRRESFQLQRNVLLRTAVESFSYLDRCWRPTASPQKILILVSSEPTNHVLEKSLWYCLIAVSDKALPCFFPMLQARFLVAIFP